MNSLEVNNLTFSYEDGGTILDGLSFSVESGSAVLLAGLSGSGKTTLLYCLCGVIPNAVRGNISGSILINGEDISGKPLAEIARKIGLVFQNPDDQIVCSTIEDELAFGLENLCMEASEIRRRVDAMLEYIGLRHMAEKNPSVLSGGQKKLLTIAGVLILEPDIIVLDEPMTGLDENSRKLVYSAIMKLLGDGKAVICSEHDLSLAGYAGRVLYLKDGKLYDKP